MKTVRNIIFVLLAIIGSAFAFSNTRAAGCEVSLSLNPAQGPYYKYDKVSTTAVFKNCNVNNNKGFISVKFPDGIFSTGKTLETSHDLLQIDSFEKEFIFTPDDVGEFLIEARAEGNQGNFTKSAKINVELQKSKCIFSYIPTVSLRQISSPDQEVTINASVEQTSTTCFVVSAELFFLHGGDKVINTGQSYKISYQPQQGSSSNGKWTEKFSTKITPASLGYKSGDQVRFSFKIVGSATGIPALNEGSTEVNVGISVPPEAQVKYACNSSNTCIQGTTGDFVSLVDCQKACGTGGGTTGTGTTGGTTGTKPQPTTIKFTITNPLGTNDIFVLLTKIGGFLFNLAIPIAVILITYSGFMFLTAAGNSGRITTGKETLKYTVIGLAVLFIGKGFYTLVISILNLGKK